MTGAARGFMRAFCVKRQSRGRTKCNMDNQNNSMKDISVLVLIYNSKYEKIRPTLNSIVCQKNINYEIIFADDGSKEQHMDEIHDFFVKIITKYHFFTFLSFYFFFCKFFLP